MFPGYKFIRIIQVAKNTGLLMNINP